MKKIQPQLLILGILILFASCEKEAGEGGTSFIKGKVYAKYYNKNFSILADSAYAPDVYVYIIYGDNPTFGERQRTSYDGSYKFDYLKTGSYKVYSYSRDSTGASKNQVNIYSPDIAVVKEITISNKKETVEVPDIEVLQ